MNFLLSHKSNQKRCVHVLTQVPITINLLENLACKTACFVSYLIPFKILAFETLLPLRFSIDHTWGEYGYFLEQHNRT